MQIFLRPLWFYSLMSRLKRSLLDNNLLSLCTFNWQNWIQFYRSLLAAFEGWAVEQTIFSIRMLRRKLFCEEIMNKLTWFYSCEEISLFVAQYIQIQIHKSRSVSNKGNHVALNKSSLQCIAIWILKSIMVNRYAFNKVFDRFLTFAAVDDSCDALGIKTPTI